MEVKGAALLYTLATLAVTFAGFAALNEMTHAGNWLK